jgi:hypothetical protein
MQEEDDVPEPRTITSSQKKLLVLIAALTIGGLAYRLITRHHMEQTALLFIGLPGILAVVLALAPPAKSFTGGILRGITLFLLMSAPILGEGFICILMAAPIFLAIGLIVGLIMDHDRKRHTTLSCCLLVLIPMSLEGTTASLSFNRIDQASSTAIVEGTPAEVQQRLAKSPRLDLKLPLYLRLGFPRPTSATGEGIAPGDLRTIHFAGGEGMPEDIVFQVASSTSSELNYTVVHDGDNMMHTLSHWVGLREANVTWAPVDATHTRVTWQIAYERRLDPAWYFGPWERYAGRVATRYLIAANAGPR